MKDGHPFHEDLFKRIRDLFPIPAIPKLLPNIPRRRLNRDDDAFEQRRLTFLPALRILTRAVPVLVKWRGSALNGLRSRVEGKFVPLSDDRRTLMAKAWVDGSLAGQANDLMTDVFSSTVAAACQEVCEDSALRREVLLLEHPNLGLFRTGEGTSVADYMYFVTSVGVRIMTTLVMQAFDFADGSLNRAIELARRSEPLVMLGAAMSALSANFLFGLTGGSLGDSKMRGFLQKDDMEVVEWPGLGEILRPRREVVVAAGIGLLRFFGDSVSRVKPIGRFGCVALRVRVGELNLVQFIYRWMLDALLEAKSN